MFNKKHIQKWVTGRDRHYKIELFEKLNLCYSLFYIFFRNFFLYLESAGKKTYDSQKSERKGDYFG